MKREKKKSVLIPVILSLLTIFGLSLGLLFFYNNIEPVIVSGTSMFPTLRQDDKLLVLETKNLSYNDIISFHAPDNDTEYYIKRVIGIPGDTIEYKDDVLYRNGEAVSEPYLDELKDSHNGENVTENFNIKTLSSTKSETVPENTVFVMGDNRVDSKDSRYFGFVDMNLVIGKVVYPKINSSGE